MFATIILKLTGDVGTHGMQGAIAIGSIICVSAAIAGDTSQDLKTGYLFGSTPKKQQIGEVLGVVAAAFAIGGITVSVRYCMGISVQKNLERLRQC